VLLLASALVQAAIAQANSAKDRVGLWQAKRRFGPDVRGTLVTRRIGGNRWSCRHNTCTVCGNRPNGDPYSWAISYGTTNRKSATSAQTRCAPANSLA
jgi:hypothetical protein